MNRSEYTLLLHLANKPKITACFRDILEHPWSTRQECSERIGVDTIRSHTWSRLMHHETSKDYFERDTKPIYCKHCGHLIRRDIVYRIKPGRIDEVRTVIKALEGEE